MDSSIDSLSALLEKHSKQRILGKLAAWAAISIAVIGELLSYRGSHPSLSVHPALLWLALACYLGSHLLRATRLWLILFEEQVPWRTVVGLHAATSLAGFLLPFKLGDLLRISEISSVLENVRKGITVQVVDRFFDLLVLILLSGVAVMLGHISAMHLTPEATVVLFVLALLAFMATVFYLTVPNFIAYCRHIIILRSRAKRGLRALEWLGRLEELYGGVITLIRNRCGILLLITLAIWMLELLVACSLLSFFSAFSFTEVISQLFTRFNFVPDANASSEIPAAFGWVVAGYVAAAAPFASYYLFLRLRALAEAWQRACFYGKPYRRLPDHYNTEILAHYGA